MKLNVGGKKKEKKGWEVSAGERRFRVHYLEGESCDGGRDRERFHQEEKKTADTGKKKENERRSRATMGKNDSNQKWGGGSGGGKGRITLGEKNANLEKEEGSSRHERKEGGPPNFTSRQGKKNMKEKKKIGIREEAPKKKKPKRSSDSKEGRGSTSNCVRRLL